MTYQFIANTSVAVRLDGSADTHQYIGVNKGAKKSLKAEEKAREQLSPHHGALASKYRKFAWSETYTTEAKGGLLTDLGALEKPECHLLMLACGMLYRQGYDIVVDTIVGVKGFATGDTLTNTTATVTLGKIIDVIVTDSVTTLRVVAASLPAVPLDNDALLATNGTTAAVNGPPEEIQVYYRTSVYSEMQALEVKTVEDLRLKISKGVRGNGKYTTDGFGLFEWSLNGVYVDNPTNISPVDALVSPVVPSITDGARVRIGDMIFDDSVYKIQKFDFDMGNKVEDIPAQQSENGIGGTIINGLAPTGNVSFLVLPYSDFNPYALLKATETVRISHAIGTVAGNRVEVVIPHAQFDTPDDSGDTVGIATYNLKFSGRREPNNTVPPYYFMFN